MSLKMNDFLDTLAQSAICPSLNGTPIIFDYGEGPFLFDNEGNKYIDFENDKGALILGHNPSDLNEKIIDFLYAKQDVRTGFTEVIFNLTSLISNALGYDKLAYFKTGTEAVKAAVFSAKNYNNKKIVLSSGYHGYDPIWKFSGELGKANNNGIIDFFFDLELFEKLLDKYENDISAVIISPDPLYLTKEWFDKINYLLEKKDIIIIADEVKVGFRYNFGLYVTQYGLNPDIAVISKSIGNGFPISVVCGYQEIMKACTNLNYTCFFDSLAFFVADKVMRALSDRNFYKMLNQFSTDTINIIGNLIDSFDLPIRIKQNGSIFQFIFPDKEASDIFFDESIKQGLIFYPGDNQCLSYAFGNEVLYSELKIKCISLFEQLKKNSLFKKGRETSLEWEVRTAWNLMDGLPTIEIPIKLKEKLLRELPE